MLADYLAIGHITRDIFNGVVTTGGCVYYAAITVQKLGLSVAIVTSYSDDFEFPEEIRTSKITTLKSDRTTTFVNEYGPKDGFTRRRQIVAATADNISMDDIPISWRSIPLVHFGPLVNELGPDVVKGFPNSFKIASIQGWTRKWDSDGNVSNFEWDGSDILPYVDVAVCSKEDINSIDDLERWRNMVPMLIVTDGPKGARLFFEGNRIDIGAIKAKEVDPTGAGDVFAASFIVKYRETLDYEDAARFASLIAGMSVEGYGASMVPSRDIIW